jgi:signal recognition particle subunit SRP54
MFDELSQRFEDAVKGLRGQATISESNVDDALKQVRRALLEADTSRKRRSEVIDQVAAGYILQGALDRMGYMSRAAT